MAIRLNIIQLRLYISLSLHVLLPTVLCVFPLSLIQLQCKALFKNKKKTPSPNEIIEFVRRVQNFFFFRHSFVFLDLHHIHTYTYKYA